MGRIQSTIGLITGLPIQDTVNQLLQVEARPRDLLVSRTDNLSARQVAITELTAAVLGVQFSVASLEDDSLFRSKSASVSQPSALSATVTGEPAVGSYQVTPIRQASTHQLVSGGVAARDEPLGEGSFSFRFGGFVDQSVRLEELNGGAGVQQGEIRITDRSGASEVVDLRFAQTVDDVLEAINDSQTINVAAVAQGDSIKLIDQTGQSGANLKVQEVGAGSTAADLGLAGIDVDAGEVLGGDVLRLNEAIKLERLNQGNGASISDSVPDLDVTFRDGTTLLIDIHADGAEAKETTLADLLKTINEADPARLQAELSADGDRIELTDLTADTGGAFSVSSALGGSLAEDLGLTGAAQDGVIAGRRLLSGLKTSLLNVLGGGQGVGELGELKITDRSGASATVDLSGAETLDEVLSAINTAGVGVTASINASRNGVEIRDTTGTDDQNLVISDGDDGKETAQKLRIAVDEAVTTVNSGSLDLQTVSETTQLDSLFGGRGVSRDSFIVIDSAGQATTVRLDALGVSTVGDVLEVINTLAAGVEAKINDRGDGITLIDTAGGDDELTVRELGAGRAAADLQLLGGASTQLIGGEEKQVIEGSSTVRIELEEEDTLEDLVTKINELGAGAAANIFTDGSGQTPHRLSLISQVSGVKGELLVETDSLGFSLTEVSAAQDALLAFGAASNGGVLISSDNNKFDQLIDGVSLNVLSPSDDPVVVSINTTDSSVVSAVQVFVDQYNKLVDKLDALTFFNESDGATGVLFGSSTALRLETDLTSLLTGRFFGVGDIQSLEEIGVEFGESGKLSLDAATLQTKFAADSKGLEKFFTTETTGFAAKVDALAEQLAGEGNSLLVNRAGALQRRIETNNERIEFLNQRLENRRELLLLQFYNMELAIGKIQSNLSAVQQIQALPPLFSQSG